MTNVAARQERVDQIYRESTTSVPHVADIEDLTRVSSLGKPRDAHRRSSGQIFLSHFHTHDKFLYCRPLENGKHLNGYHDKNFQCAC